MDWAQDACSLASGRLTERKPQYFRVENAKKSTIQEMVDYCKDNDIILQPIVAYNHTM